ncbi:hypothetical protein VTG60DRAFT_6189 [Thermothelomyces hinnuleus]
MRWRLPGARSTLPASVALLLLPVLVAPQQLQEQSRHDAPVPSAVSNPLRPTAPVPANPNENPSPSALNVKSNDASALATLALAGSGRAVRAPPAQASSSSSSAGMVPQLHTRSLQDWEVEDFVLLATVDGTIHTRDRKTGAPRWALEVPSNPMVASYYHRANRSSFDQTQPEDDFLWIVEPSQDGSLYIFSPDPNTGLQQLGLTVKELVDETPYSGTDPAVTYTARKETTLYAVDERTGSILRVFSSRGPIPSAPECRKVDDFDTDVNEECECPSENVGAGSC